MLVGKFSPKPAQKGVSLFLQKKKQKGYYELNCWPINNITKNVLKS
jgi:hypothetical protein